MVRAAIRLTHRLSLVALSATACLLVEARAQRVTPSPVSGVVEGSVASRLFSDRRDGVSCTFFDVGLALGWPSGGRVAHRDKTGLRNGPAAWAERALSLDSGRVLRLDVSAAVQAKWNLKNPELALLLRLQGELLRLHSREDADPSLRPQLMLKAANGRIRFVEPVADAALDCSTFQGLGEQQVLTLHRDAPLAIRFDLVEARRALGDVVPTAELILVRYGNRSIEGRLSAFGLESPLAAPSAGLSPDIGISACYPGDAGIERDADVLFADAFERSGPSEAWVVGDGGGAETVAADRTPGFTPLIGRALRVRIARGKQLGLDLRFRFARSSPGGEPEEVYFRYCLLLAHDWLGASDGGKLPGLAGTYGRAGWGGRPWDGQTGWSLRGSFSLPPVGHPAHGRVMLGSYAYHSGNDSRFGEGWVWAGSELAGLMEPGRWVCIEQHLRLNTPGHNDGLLQVWIDGRPAFARSDIRLRDRAGIRIEEVWMNVFHGGTALAPRDMHAWIDQVVIARRYIGPPQAQVSR